MIEKDIEMMFAEVPVLISHALDYFSEEKWDKADKALYEAKQIIAYLRECCEHPRYKYREANYAGDHSIIFNANTVDEDDEYVFIIEL